MNEKIGWSATRFTYTKEQIQWIEQALAINGNQISAVIEMMADLGCGFPQSESLKTFNDAVLWVSVIERVARGDFWDNRGCFDKVAVVAEE